VSVCRRLYIHLLKLLKRRRLQRFWLSQSLLCKRLNHDVVTRRVLIDLSPDIDRWWLLIRQDACLELLLGICLLLGLLAIEELFRAFHLFRPLPKIEVEEVAVRFLGDRRPLIIIIKRIFELACRLLDVDLQVCVPEASAVGLDICKYFVCKVNLARRCRQGTLEFRNKASPVTFSEQVH